MDSRPDPNRRPVARFIARGLAVMLLVASMATAAALRYWTDPVTVRRLVLEQLRAQFPGAEVTLDHARLWPGWGIHVSNLCLARKDDPALMPVLQVPSGRVEYDTDLFREGKLRVRRLKLEKPRLTAVRDSHGKWNVDGLIGQPKPGIRLPIVVIERGTLVLRIVPPGGGESAWEVGGLRASLFEESNGLARFEGRGESARLGKLSVEGAWLRPGGQIEAAVDITGLPLNLDFLREAARFAPVPVELVRRCSGSLRVQLDARRRPDEGPGWQHDWRVSVSDGTLGLRDLPMDLTAIELTAHLRDGRMMLKEAHALAADAPVHAMGEIRLPADEPMAAIESVALSAERLLITPELFTRLPEGAKRFQQRFAPVGRVSCVYQFAKRKAGGWDARLELKPEDMAGRYHKFPYPLRKVRGTMVTELASDQPSRHALDLTGEANGGARVALRGRVGGAEPYPAVDLWIGGVNSQPACDLPVDDDLIAALPPRFQPLAKQFNYRGTCDIAGRIHHAEGCPLGHDQYHVKCRDAAVTYDLFPVPLEQVAAELEIHLGPGLPGDSNRGDYWVLKNATARHGGGRVAIDARSSVVPHGQQITIEMTGAGVPLGPPIAKALAVYKLGSTWELLAPNGAIDFSTRVSLTDTAEQRARPAVTLAVRGANITPGFFPLPLSDFAAHIHSEPGRTLIGECSGRHGLTRLQIGGGEVRTDHGLWVDLREVRADPLPADATFAAALPQTLQKVFASVQPAGMLGFHLKRMVLHDPPAIPGPPGPPVLYWDGTLALNDVALTTGVDWTGVRGSVASRGAVKGSRLEWLTGHMVLDGGSVLRQPVANLHAHLLVDPEVPDVLRVLGLRGQMFGGDLTGEARLGFGGGLDYALDVKALGVQLQDFGRHNRIGAGKLEGRASAQLYLTGRGGGLAELSGRGDIDVPSGQLYDLPIALELIKAVTLRAPDGVAFEEAHANFKLEGPKLHVERLDLLGSAVSLGGRGSLNLDGSDVNLDFYAVWARIAQVLPVGWRDVPPWVSRQFLKITMRGSLDQPKFAPEPVPFVTEPAKRLMERMKRE